MVTTNTLLLRYNDNELFAHRYKIVLMSKQAWAIKRHYYEIKLSFERNYHLKELSNA